MQTIIAKMQCQLAASDLELVLALARAGTLAKAGEKLGLDPSTVFRSLQRLERDMGQRLFERARTGYQPTEMAHELARVAEQMEAQLEEARAIARARPQHVTGTVRITTTDSILHGLVAPALKALQDQHPFLTFDLHAGNELASLTRRDADIAIRATKKPPQHLVGKQIGPIRVALFASTRSPIKGFDATVAAEGKWIAPDEALPDHPSVVWRKRHFPKVSPAYRVNSILTVAEFVAQGMGIGLLPLFLAAQRKDLRQLTDPIDECQTELWLLTHTEARHLRRVATVYGHLARSLQLT